MKIVEVVYGLASGGAERLVVDLSNELSKTNDVTLLVLKKVSQFYQNQVDKRVHLLFLDWKVGFDPFSQFKAYSIIKELSPDIVHYHSGARYSMILANVLLKNRIKFYMTIHSDVELNYNKGISGLQVRIAGHLGRCKFITISPTNYTQFANIHPKLQQKLIHNGRTRPKLSQSINEVIQELDRYKITPNTSILIHVARFHPVKNQLLLVSTVNDLIQDGKDISLVVIGDYFNTEAAKDVISYSSERIHFIGPKDNVYDYLSQANIFCLSSDYEGMPMSLIEAMLSGLPSVSTPVCGAKDIIINGVNGFLSDNHTPKAYKEALNNCLTNYQMIKDNQRNIENINQFTISACAQNYLLWFNE